ncbi:hypothetical protein D3C85_1611950 [compost metagenome]
MHGLVADQLFQQRGGRVPGDGLQLEQAHIEPVREQRLQVFVEHAQARHALVPAEHVRAQLDQEVQAARAVVALAVVRGQPLEEADARVGQRLRQPGRRARM